MFFSVQFDSDNWWTIGGASCSSSDGSLTYFLTMSSSDWGFKLIMFYGMGLISVCIPPNLEDQYCISGFAPLGMCFIWFSPLRLVQYDIYMYIYLTAVGLTPGGSSTAHMYTQTIHIIQRKENWEVRAVPHLCELYLGICLKTEEKARKNLS
jgi:hypothetical protein